MSNLNLARKDDPGLTQGGYPSHLEKQIVSTCFPVDMTGREKEAEHCLAIARHYQLNPLLKEIRFVNSASWERGRKVWTVKPLVGRDGLVALAHRSGQYGGIKTTVELRTWPTFRDGTWQNINQPVATAEVWRRDSSVPTVVSVGFWEYATREDGNIPDFWQTLGVTMTAKVAESQALRKAFDLAGLYSLEEMGVGFLDDPDAPQPKEPPPSPTPLPQAQQPEVDLRQLKLADRLAKARKVLVDDYQFIDETARENLIMEGRVEVEQDSFIVRQLNPKQAEILAWVRPDSPNSTVLAEFRFREDTASQWWSLRLVEGK